MKKERIDVLLIEDDEDDFFIVRNLLRRAASMECCLTWVQQYEEGVEEVVSEKYDVALVDYRLGARDGLTLMREAVRKGCRTPKILLTGQGDRAVDVKAMEAGATDYLVKAEVDVATLERALRYAHQRGRAEERIRHQAALLDEAHDGICTYDLDYTLTFWNRGAERITGYTAEEMMGDGDAANADERLYGVGNEALEEARRAVLEEGKWKGELRQRAKDGEELIVESRWTLVRDAEGQPASILVINTDVTERKKLETQVLRAQRMESIGRLVGGIAHDLGNLLVPVLLGVDVLQQRHAGDERDERTLAMIQKSAERGSAMVKQVLAFARGVEGEHATMQVGTVIEEVEKITSETFPAHIGVQAEVAEALWAVEADATQLQQVLMNLCVNARDAMKEKESGRLLVRAENVEVSEREARRNPEATPGQYVRLSVQDTGTGIPQREIDKIFEPFFTTKPTGEGTGLGLSTVYSIAKSHRGFVDVKSREGQGTTFYVYVPATEAEEVEETPPAAQVPRKEGAGARVLLVDDEAFIQEAGEATLRRAGYEVFTAARGDEALRLLETCPVDVVLTDLVMPGMDGTALIAALRMRAFDGPIVAMSGLSDSEVDEARTAGADYFLSKPFDAEKICAALHEVLGSDRPALQR